MHDTLQATPDWQCLPIFPYKAMKKAIKKGLVPTQPEQLEKLLQFHCKRIDSAFQQAVQRCQRRLQPASWLDYCYNICYGKSSPPLDPDSILQYGTLNSTAVYKICKKLEKNGHPGMLQLYKQMHANGAFRFLGYSQQVTWLKLHAQQQKNELSYECPICMDASNEFIIAQCGHAFCFDCVCNLTHVDQERGTLRNRIVWGSQNITCPICRHANPFNTVESSTVIPPDLADRANATVS